MLRSLSLATFGLALACTSQIWAGTTGNGSAQRNGQYAFCYAGNVNVVYFTQVMTLTPGESAPNLGVTYGDYVKKTYGLPSIDRERCVRAATSDAAAVEKQRYMGMLGTTKPVEIQWASASTQ
jgi:hypothetical protein